MRILAGILIVLLPIAASAQETAVSPVFQLVEQFDQISSHALWPGFDPRHTPLELFDGTNTYLFHHPAPPDQFRPVS